MQNNTFVLLPDNVFWLNFVAANALSGIFCACPLWRHGNAFARNNYNYY